MRLAPLTAVSSRPAADAVKVLDFVCAGLLFDSPLHTKRPSVGFRAARQILLLRPVCGVCAARQLILNSAAWHQKHASRGIEPVLFLTPNAWC